MIGRSLDLSSTRITPLPVGLTVGSGLDLADTLIREIPPDARIGGEICGLPKDMAEKHAQTKRDSAWIH